MTKRFQRDMLTKQHKFLHPTAIAYDLSRNSFYLSIMSSARQHRIFDFRVVLYRRQVDILTKTGPHAECEDCGNSSLANKKVKNKSKGKRNARRAKEYYRWVLHLMKSDHTERSKNIGNILKYQSSLIVKMNGGKYTDSTSYNTT